MYLAITITTTAGQVPGDLKCLSPLLLLSFITNGPYYYYYYLPILLLLLLLLLLLVLLLQLLLPLLPLLLAQVRSPSWGPEVSLSLTGARRPARPARARRARSAWQGQHAN